MTTKVWRVIDYFHNTIQYFEKYPHVRKYYLENSMHHHDIEVEVLEWHYKTELVKILNESLALGMSFNATLKQHQDS